MDAPPKTFKSYSPKSVGIIPYKARDVMTLWILKWGDYSGLSGGSGVVMRVPIGGTREGKRKKCEDGNRGQMEGRNHQRRCRPVASRG